MFDPVVCISLVGFLTLLYVLARSRWSKPSSSPSLPHEGNVSDKSTHEIYNDIEPLEAFDWRATPPAKIWSLKPKYHLTMGLENLPISDLLAMDNTYLDRIRLRQQIMDENPVDETRACLPSCEEAVYELYTWLLSTYLPKRFPTIYQLNPVGTHVHNAVTNEDIPVKPSSPLEALTTLSTTIDTEFLILLPITTTKTTTTPTPTSDSPPTYNLQAYTICSPSGFHMPSKLSLPLAGIHAPVPGYKAKLEKSMDRFFASLPVGKVVKRTNWSVDTDAGQLFVKKGIHLYGGGDGEADGEEGGDKAEQDGEIERQKAQVRIPDCRLRCERQTLHRLPDTGALVFAFKTYLYPLEEVKAEGPDTAESLAQAIDGLGEGNAPGMKIYKRGVVWGDAVKEYLRS